MVLASYRRGCIETENKYGMTPDQYHAGLNKLWAALGLQAVQSEDVFTLAARQIEKLTTELKDVSFSNTVSEEDYGMSPEQLRKGLTKLQKALGLVGEPNEDILAAASVRIRRLESEKVSLEEDLMGEDL